MSLPYGVLNVIFHYHGGRYKKILHLTKHYRSISADPRKNHQLLHTTLKRLKDRGLIKQESNSWLMTEKGREYFEKQLKNFLPKHSTTKNHKTIPRNVIIIFDIPEKYRRKRDWLRIELSILGFNQMQKSVWYGPAPLPESFIKNIEEIGILEYLKFFKASELDIV